MFWHRLARSPRRDCTALTSRCEFWTWGEGYLRPPCCTQHLLELAVFTSDLLSAYGIRHWLDYGSLLGAVRSGDLIPWDSDVDFGFLHEDLGRVLSLREQVEAAGHVLDHSDPLVVRFNLSERNTQHVDLYAWHERDGFMQMQFHDQFYWPGMRERDSFPKAYLEAEGEASLGGHSFPAPAPADEFLARHRYGPDYMTPRRPILAEWLNPDIAAEDVTPVVTELLDVLRARTERLWLLKTHPRLSRLTLWRRWVDAGLPLAPLRPAVQRLRSELGVDKLVDPVVDQILESVALMDRGIDEFEHPTARMWVSRLGRRVLRLARKARSAGPGRH